MIALAAIALAGLAASTALLAGIIAIPVALFVDTPADRTRTLFISALCLTAGSALLVTLPTLRNYLF